MTAKRMLIAIELRESLLLIVPVISGQFKALLIARKIVSPLILAGTQSS
jgi:hypothetical protein